MENILLLFLRKRGYLNIEEVTRELSESKSMVVKTRKKIIESSRGKSQKTVSEKNFYNEKNKINICDIRINSEIGYLIKKVIKTEESTNKSENLPKN